MITRHMLTPSTFKMGHAQIKWMMENAAHEVSPKYWQGVNVEQRPEMRSHELLNLNLNVDLQQIEDLDYWREDIKPNLPWADDHFEERVCGFPLNPGTEWANWPWGKSAAKFLDNFGQFNHNYMERYWPKWASRMPYMSVEQYCGSLAPNPHRGIRNDYGDLNDLIRQLLKDPYSRQEWFPIFHPEDVGEVEGGRKPCSLGYQFIMREDLLHVYYPLRSCDFIRHWADDCYLTVRLLLWLLERLREEDINWQKVRPGSYHMHCTSLHVFANDLGSL